MKTKFKSIIIVLFVLFMFSCEADVDLNSISGDINLNPSLILPLGGADIQLGQFYTYFDDQQYIKREGAGFYYQSFDSTEFTFRDVDIVGSSRGFLTSILLSPDASVFYPTGTAVPNINSSGTLDLNINSNPLVERLDSVVFSTLIFSVQIDVSSDLVYIQPQDLLLKVKFPNGIIKKIDGSSSDISFTPSAFGQTGSFQITDAILKTVNATGIPLQIETEIKNNTGIYVSPRSEIKIDLNVTEIKYNVAYGYFEPEIISSKIFQRKINLKDNLPNGLLKFNNPQIDISTNSNLGANLRFDVDYIKAFVSTDNSIEPIFAWFEGHTSMSASEVLQNRAYTPGEWATNNLQKLDKDRGETNQLFQNETKVDMFEYKFSTKVDNELSSKNLRASYITPDVKIKVNIKFTFPFDLNAGSYYVYTDTIANLNINIAETIEKYYNSSITKADVIFDISNGLPLNALLNFKFFNSLGSEVLKDLNQTYTVLSGKVDANGVLQPGKETKQVLTLTVNKSQIDQLKEVESIVYNVQLDGKDTESKIFISDFNTFRVNIGLFVSGNFKTTL